MCSVMYQQRYETDKRRQDCYICGSYKKRTADCTAHFIRTDLLTAGVTENLRKVTSYAAKHEARFMKLLMAQNEDGGKRKNAARRRELEAAQKRIGELNGIFKRLYEDSVSGRITDERFMELSADYEQEQATLKARVAELQAELGQAQEAAVNVEKFMVVVRKYISFEELTPTLLREFVEKIVVHECWKDEQGTRHQDIEIYYSFVGKVDFGCMSGKIETSPCTGKWRGTSDISIRFDNGASLFIGNHRTPQAKTAKVQNECVSSALVRYNPEIIKITKESALDALRKRETKDNETAAQKGLKPYTLLNVEFNDGMDEKSGGHMGWYYVTLAVGGEIRPHIETGLNYEILDGKVSETPTRENYYAAGALKESDVDYVFNNVGFSSTSGLYSLPVSEEVRERAEKTLAELGGIQALEQPAPDGLMTGERIATPRGSFSVTAMSREQMEAAGYGVHHQSDDGKYLIMGNGKRAFAIAAEPPENYLKADRQNADRTDNVLNNEKPTGRVSVREKLAEKKAVIGQRDKAGKDIPEKKTEKKSGREI